MHKLMCLVEHTVRYKFRQTWWNPIEGTNHVTFFFECDPDDYLDFTILRNGAYKIVNGGVHMGTWPLRYLPDFFHNLFFGVRYEDTDLDEDT